MQQEREVRALLDLFSLESEATLSDLKDAYRDLMKVWHPDRFLNDERLKAKAEKKAKDINHAYARLESYLSSRTNHRSPVKPRGASPKREPSRPAVFMALIRPVMAVSNIVQDIFSAVFGGHVRTCAILVALIVWFRMEANNDISTLFASPSRTSFTEHSGYRLISPGRHSSRFLNQVREVAPGVWTSNPDIQRGIKQAVSPGAWTKVYDTLHLEPILKKARAINPSKMPLPL